MTAWATVQDCTDITGVTPTSATLALAQSIIEDHCGRTPDADASFRTRDLVWLKKAVAYQAAWIPSQPGLLARVGADGVSQDGLTAQFRSAADQFVAPYAQRVLKNLSWMGTRSIHIRPRTDLTVVSDAAWLRESSDPETGWVAL